MRYIILSIALFFFPLNILFSASLKTQLIEITLTQPFYKAARFYYTNLLAGRITPREDDYGLISGMEDLLKKYRIEKLKRKDWFFFFCKWYTLFRYNDILCTEYMKKLSELTFFSGDGNLRTRYLGYYQAFLSRDRARQIQIVLSLNSHFVDPLLQIFKHLETEAEDKNKDEDKPEKKGVKKIVDKEAIKGALQKELTLKQKNLKHVMKTLGILSNPRRQIKNYLRNIQIIGLQRKMKTLSRDILDLQGKLQTLK
ncbi:hypothetical protein ACFL35_19265 [Candidatus Riflebacteria bacterium]